MGRFQDRASEIVSIPSSRAMERASAVALTSSNSIASQGILAAGRGPLPAARLRLHAKPVNIPIILRSEGWIGPEGNSGTIDPL